MRLRRTVALAVFVLLGVVLVLAVRPPERRPVHRAARGHRVFDVKERAVRGLEVRLDERALRARRTPAGWAVDGVAASPRLAAALDDLVATLATLRAVDVFRPRDGARFGFDAPRGAVTVETRGRRRHVVLGASNAAGSTVYARRDRDPRVLQLGILLLSTLERVLWTRDTEKGQLPEIG
jgi:hypothetical protein